jgi:hypothetical protein
MKKIIYAALAILVVAFLVYTVSTQKNNKPEPQKQEQVNNSSTSAMHTVKVKDFINTSNYTYMQVEENGNDYWIAVTKMPVNKGETLYFAKSMEMKDFHSTELNRTFDKVLFVDGIAKSPNNKNGTFTHPEINKSPEINQKVTPLPGGKTVKDIFANSNELSGKTVRIRGEVVKVNSGIMGRNWIHIQDGTSSNGQYDLLVTTNQEAKMGDIVVFEGKVSINKDFGAGYKYPVMIEEAKVISGNKKS